MIESAFLVFSLAINPSAPVHPNYVVQYDTAEQCVAGANAYASEFAKSYPYGLFVGHCLDSENRVFYLKRSRQFETSGESN
jgi:hypothetical protein